MLFQAGSLTVFLLFWQVPDIFGETKIDQILQVVSFISEQFTELKQEVSLISDKLNVHTKLSQNTSSELKQEDDSPLNQDACIKGQPHKNGRVMITLWDNTTALCDTTTDGGGWIIIQRQTAGYVNFNRGWNEYKSGFGVLDTDYWLGNNPIHLLTDQGYNELRIELIYQRKLFYAHYSNFSVASEALNYRLTVGAFEGTAGDSLTYHNNMSFTTFDRDNDKWDNGNCADEEMGGWWYNHCQESNLNGQWGEDAFIGVRWDTLSKDRYVPVLFSEMKIRRG